MTGSYLSWGRCFVSDTSQEKGLEAVCIPMRLLAVHIQSEPRAVLILWLCLQETWVSGSSTLVTPVTIRMVSCSSDLISKKCKCSRHPGRTYVLQRVGNNPTKSQESATSVKFVRAPGSVTW